jgi:hypothetical protein
MLGTLSWNDDFLGLNENSQSLTSNRKSSIVLDDGYAGVIDAAVRNSIAAGDAAVGDIAVRLGDVDPAQILDVVKRLGRNDLIAKSSAAAIIGTSQRVHSITLPIPHPLDYDWRLSEDSVEAAARILASAAGHGRACLVGAPTVFRCFVEEDGLAGGADLYDFSLDTIRAFETLSADDGKYAAFLSDARYDLPHTSGYSAAFLDPPWYLDDIVAFLQFASAGCAIGSTVYVSMPGLRTRPGVQEERDFAASVMRDLGLEVRAERNDALSYETPPFERRAFRQRNIDPPAIWRRGMLLRLEKVSEPPRRPIATKPELERWDDITYAGVRFRVRLKPGNPQGDPVLRPAVEGAILPSVSRRDPRRGPVDVWTSGNGVYLCTGSAKLLCVLRALAKGESAREAVEQLVGRRLSADEDRQIDALATQIADIVAAERYLYP